MCDAARAAWGFAIYDRVALVGIPVISAGAVALVLFRLRAHIARRVTLASAVVLTAATLAAQHWLLVANIELIHFPAVRAALGRPARSRPAQAACLSRGDGSRRARRDLPAPCVVYAGRAGTYLRHQRHRPERAWRGLVRGPPRRRHRSQHIARSWTFRPRRRIGLARRSAGWDRRVVGRGVARSPRFSPLLVPTATGRYRVCPPRRDWWHAGCFGGWPCCSNGPQVPSRGIRRPLAATLTAWPMFLIVALLFAGCASAARRGCVEAGAAVPVDARRAVRRDVLVRPAARRVRRCTGR